MAFKAHESTRDRASSSPKIDETGRIYMIHNLPAVAINSPQ